MNRWSSLSVALVIVLVAIASSLGCSKPASTAAPASAVRPPVAVSVATVAASDLQEVVEVTGSLEPKFSADVKSEVSGVVAQVYVTEWVAVRKGDRLARLDSTETEAGIAALEAAVAQARVADTRARREFDRAKQLKEFGLITPQNFDDARSGVEATEAAVTAALAQVTAAKTRLTKSVLFAPLGGVVARRAVNVGDRVENIGGGEPLFRIVDNRLLDLTVSVPESKLSQIKIGQPLTFATDSLPGRTFAGKVMFINPALDVASRSARVVVEVPNSSGELRGGSFVKGHIVVARRAGVLQVPREALLNWNVEKGTAEVFVTKGDQAEKRPVTTGTVGETHVEVVTGLQAGEQVVTRGGFAIGQGDHVVVATGTGA